MKKILFFLFFLLPILAWSQYPGNARKQRLGYQTTGAGLVYIKSGAPAHTPANDEDTWMVLDTTNNILYYWDEPAGAWENLLDDVVRDTVFQITNVPDTSALVPLQGDIFFNAARDTMGVYTSQWVLFFRGLRSNGLTLDFVGRYDGANGLVNADIEDDGTTVTIGFQGASEVDILPADTTTIGGAVSRLGGQADNRITVDDDTGQTDIVAVTGVDITAGSPAQSVDISSTGITSIVNGTDFTARNAGGSVSSAVSDNASTKVILDRAYDDAFERQARMEIQAPADGSATTYVGIVAENDNTVDYSSFEVREAEAEANSTGLIRLAGDSLRVENYARTSGYGLPVSTPSTTLGDTTIMAWRGTGSAAVPLGFIPKPSGGGGSGDNLGDHTATTNLNMDGNTILGGTGTGSDLILQSTSGVGSATSEILFLVGNNGGTEAMRIDGTGEVGIGTSTPVKPLHVQGAARITGSDGVGTRVMLRDADGDISDATLGDGITLTTGTLAANDTVTTLIQDSILVYSLAGTEVGRDTVRTPGGGGGGSGTVTSVGLSLPSQFAVSGSPVTTSGTLSGTWNAQSANTVLAGPSSGGAAAPTFRSLAAADIQAGTGYTGTLSTGYIPYHSGSRVLSNSPIYSTSSQAGVSTTTFEADATLSVGNIGANSIFHVRGVGSTGRGTMRIWNNLGSAAKYMAFHVYGSASTGTIFGASRADKAYWITEQHDTGLGSFTNNTVTIGTNNVARMFFTGSTGLIGIGTTSPGYSLDITQKTDGLGIPAGTTAQRPTGAAGVIRYNSTLTAFEGYGSSAWNSILTTQAATGKLTAGSVAFGASTGISEDNSNLFWNDTDNRLGIGTNAPDVSLDFTGKTDGVDLPAGTTAQRPTSDQGTIRFNTDLKTLEVATASTWFQTKLTGTDRALGDDTSANYGSADAGGIIQISDATNNSTIITYTLPATPEDKLEITCECKAGSVIDGDDGCRIAGNGNNIQGSANYDFAAANTTVTIRYSSVLGEWKIIY